jgi:dihydroorotate dehydrogenase
MATYELAGVELESPLLNAAGSINGTNPETILRQVETLADTAIGATTVGSFTIPRQEGNAVLYGGPVYYHNSHTGETYNAMGLPNIGLTAAVDLAPEIMRRANGKPVILSGSPTKGDEHGSSVQQAVALAYELLAVTAPANGLVEINVSCPNVVTEGGGRKPMMGYDLETMEELIEALKTEVGEGHPLGVKLPPYMSDEQHLVAASLSKLLKQSNVFSFLVTSNTIPNQVPLTKGGEHILSLPGGMGGMSGPATSPEGRAQFSLWQDLMDGKKIDKVSTLGVRSGEELKFRVEELGATAVSGVTFLWESTNWKAAVTRMLADLSA